MASEVATRRYCFYTKTKANRQTTAPVVRRMRKPVYHSSGATLQFTGLISEHRDQGRTHLLMFLFVVMPNLRTLPPVHAAGWFQSFACAALSDLN